MTRTRYPLVLYSYVHELFVRDPSAPCFPTHSHIPPLVMTCLIKPSFFVWSSVLLQKIWNFLLSQIQWFLFLFWKIRNLHGLSRWLEYFVNSLNWLNWPMYDCHLGYITKLKERTLVPCIIWCMATHCILLSFIINEKFWMFEMLGNPKELI